MMSRTCRILLLLAAFLLPAVIMSAQQNSVGFFNSVKGFGVSFSMPTSEYEYESLTLFSDIYGIPSGRTKSPGVKFNYTHQFVLIDYELEDSVISLYAGPGLSAGYLFDHEPGAFADYDVALAMNKGFACALSGTAGCLFNFSRGIVLDLFWTVEGGIHMRRDETLGNIDLKLYKNGFTQAWLPQLAVRAFF